MGKKGENAGFSPDPAPLLLFEVTLEEITYEDTDDEEDHVNDDLDKNTKCPEETGENSSGKHRYESKYDPEDDADDDSPLEEAHLVLLPGAEEAECDANNEDQQ